MVQFPVDKYLLADYREQLRTFSAPQDLDTDYPILPVIPISQPLGFPKPNSKQILRIYNVVLAAAGDVQVATVSSSTNIYFVGAIISTAAGGTYGIADLTSGTVNQTNGDTTTLAYGGTAAQLNLEFKPALPYKCTSGIRVSGIGAFSLRITIYYIEERLV